MSRRRRRLPKPCSAHVAPPEAAPVEIASEVPLLIRLEREVEDEFRPAMCVRLSEKVATATAALPAPRCECGRAMKSRGRRSASFVTRFGPLTLRPTTYRCKVCKRQRRPVLETLALEAGRVSGSLARLLALLGVVVPYQLAARLAYLFFGTEVSPMTVWRSVQRLGQAVDRYVDQQAKWHGDPRRSTEEGAGPASPDAVVLGVDGSALGMQVRAQRRRRQSGEALPPLPPVEDGRFREVKTGVLLLPHERVETSPGRRSVLRRVLVSCLGDADRVFERLWSKLQELKWLGPNTVVVMVGDGAEWIWRRASMFPRRCEILDFWHAVEHAWDFARLRFGPESKQAVNWVGRIAEDLRAGKVGAVLARLRKLEVTGDEKREALATLIRYYDDNQDRMKYDEYLRKGYGIGSGAVESAHKQVVHARMRQAGMRWSERGARCLLALRILLLNDQWSFLDRLTMTAVVA